MEELELVRQLQYIIKTAGLADLIDILLVAFVIYKGMRLIKDTNAVRLVKGIFLLVILMQISIWFSFNTMSFILEYVMTTGLIALVVVFQPELRKALETVGKSRISSILDKEKVVSEKEKTIARVVDACATMSKSKTGALIIFQRTDRLSDVMKTGTVLDAAISAELIKNVFYPKSPLHDGAMMIADNRIVAAACVLPLSANQTLSKDLGTRHRAAVGTTELYDAVAVTVSEETGSMSLSVGGMLKRHLSPETLEKILISELTLPDEKDKVKKKGWFNRGKGR